MGAKPGYRPSGTRARILRILADGVARNVREITDELIKTETRVFDPYGAAANALHTLADRGDVKRERINRKWHYWREIAQEEAHG